MKSTEGSRTKIVRQPMHTINHDAEKNPSVTTDIASHHNSANGHRNVSSRDPLTPTIFHEEWWLDAATGGNFDVAEVTAGGRTLGRLPFSIRSHFGLRIMNMPDLTYFLGPAIDEGEGSSSNRFLKRLEITRELIERLPHAPWQYFKCHAGIKDVIAFQEHGFRTCVQFSHEVTPDPVETLWQKMRDKTRNVIRRAEERLTVEELDDPVEFIRLFEENLLLKGSQNGIDGTSFRKITSIALERRRGRILAARNGDGQVVAANFCVWDTISCFYVLSTRCDNSGNGAGSLLIWEAIKDSARRGLVFDFAGLGSVGSVLLYTGFGGSITPRYVAVRAHPFTRIVREVKSLLQGESFFY
jgi:hypothetical protein